MKIDTEWGERGALVAAFYDVDGVRHFLYVSDRDAEGANVARASECTIVDGDISHFSASPNDTGQTLWLDDAAREDDLLDAMVEHEPDAVRKFWSRLDARQARPPGNAA